MIAGHGAGTAGQDDDARGDPASESSGIAEAGRPDHTADGEVTGAVAGAETGAGTEGSSGPASEHDRTEPEDTEPEPEDRLAEALVQRDEYLDALRRLQAEFENYKKRVAKQQGDQIARAAAALVEKVLPVLDTLDMATEHLGDPGSTDGRALVAVAGQLRDVLAKEGLERIDPLGEAFDPNTHDAVGHVPVGTEDDSEVGGGDDAADDSGGDTADAVDHEPVVAQVMRAGYRWRGTVVRPAMVTVRG
ncbi:MAG: nucleotide exchange factor GrpE [Acidimicrobiales bacterium]